MGMGWLSLIHGIPRTVVIPRDNLAVLGFPHTVSKGLKGTPQGLVYFSSERGLDSVSEGIVETLEGDPGCGKKGFSSDPREEQWLE